MTHRSVQSVFFWRADMTSVFKATYGREPQDTTYTKDFHQPRGGVARALERALGVPEGGDTPVEWRWPGGSYPHGRFKPAADFAGSAGRMNLRWETDNAPPPWRLTQNPSADSLSTLQGRPSLRDADEANAQLVALQAAGEGPWLIAVHLHGDGPVLHARVVLEDPQQGREFASWESLPPAVRDAMRALPTGKPGGFVEFEEGLPVRAGGIVDRIMAAFRENPNVLLVGPPGTGKTIAMDDVRRSMEEDHGVGFDPDVLHGAWSQSTAYFDGETRVQALVFHPSYAYEDFVIGLLPEPADEGGVTVRPRVGPLLDLAHFASEPGRRALLLCDEFNRGAAASIFGDTLALLDGDKRSTPGEETGATIATPYFHLEPENSDDEPLGEETSLPSSLFILAAMNSADRSVAPLDAALRRRFAILHVDPDYDVLQGHLGVTDAFELGNPEDWTTPEHVCALAIEILRAVNERIEAVSGRDFLLGQSVMWNVGGDNVATAFRSLGAAMDNNVLGTLTLSYVDNDAALAAVLNVDPRGEEEPGSTSGAATWHQPSESIRQVASPRLRPVRFQSLGNSELSAALASLL